MKFIEHEKLNKTLSADELLSDYVFGGLKNNPAMRNAIKQSTILSFWNSVVGKKFEKITNPTKIQNSILFVDAKSPVVVQELSLVKKKLIEKMNSYSLPLGISVNDIVLSYKNFKNQSENLRENFIEDKPVQFQKESLENTQLDCDFQEEIKNNINKISFLNNEQKNSLISKIFDVKRAEIIRKN